MEKKIVQEVGGSKQHEIDIFERLKGGEQIHLNDPQYFKIQEVVDRTIQLSAQLNVSSGIDEARARLSDLLGITIDETTVVFIPFFTNFGKFITIGKNVFINHACSFLDMGGITIEDHVLIGPKVNLITENHPIDPLNRRALICKPIVIKRNAWIGAAATILPGVTVGRTLWLQPALLFLKTWPRIPLWAAFLLS